ncbi:hypothetical protein NY08_3664 [Rhodococcus sp. B7740]|nr:hypothetical protein NY08_3664 [Rhodococcus sp. B7740]
MKHDVGPVDAESSTGPSPSGLDRSARFRFGLGWRSLIRAHGRIGLLGRT